MTKRMSPKGAAAERKMHKVMSEYKQGTLHSGSPEGPIVKDRAQAIAIGINSARRAKKRRKKGY